MDSNGSSLVRRDKQTTVPPAGPPSGGDPLECAVETFRGARACIDSKTTPVLGLRAAKRAATAAVGVASGFRIGIRACRGINGLPPVASRCRPGSRVQIPPPLISDGGSRLDGSPRWRPASRVGGRRASGRLPFGGLYLVLQSRSTALAHWFPELVRCQKRG